MKQWIMFLVRVAKWYRPGAPRGGRARANAPGTKGPEGARATNVDHGTQMVGQGPVKCLKVLPRDAKPSLRIDVGPCHSESYKPNTTLFERYEEVGRSFVNYFKNMGNQMNGIYIQFTHLPNVFYMQICELSLVKSIILPRKFPLAHCT